MKAMAPLDFSHVIAFLLPGFVAFYALIYVSPRASELVTACLAMDTGAGVWLMLLLFSLAAGIVVSAFRALAVDNLQFFTGVQKPNLDYSKLTNENTLGVFNEAIANTYRFAQFYGNMLVSVVLLLLAKLWFSSDILDQWLVFAVMSLAVLVLFIAHRSQLDETYKKLGQILT